LAFGHAEPEIEESDGQLDRRLPSGLTHPKSNIAEIHTTDIYVARLTDLLLREPKNWNLPS
jgi:hypothetical protein